MKKFLLAVALMGGVMGAYAQDDVYAPTAGTLSTEIQFTPFSGDKIFDNGGVLSARYFCTDKDAFLVEFGLSGTNDKEVSDTNVKNAFTKQYQGKFSLALGYQRHFFNYKRIDLYVGGKVGYVHEFAGYKDQQDKNNWTWNNEGTGNGFNIYLTTGIDFYVYKGLYLGAEINAGFEDILATNVTTKTCYDGKETEFKTNVGGHSFSGGFSVQPRIRLGWAFK